MSEVFTGEMNTENAVTMQDAAEGAQQTLADVLGAEEAPETAASEQPEEAQQQQTASEPGWMQKRIDAAIRKATPGIQQQVQAQYQAQIDALNERLAGLQQAEMEREADRMVAAGEIKNRETALELLRLRNGIPAEVKAQQPRNEKGQYTTTTQAADSGSEDVNARARELIKQVNAIKKATGTDMLAMYKGNAELQEKINSGEWDFADAYREYTASQKRAPGVVRSANGVGIGEESFRQMSSKRFADVNALLEGGGKIDMRR